MNKTAGMAKITKLKQDIGFYYDLALDKGDEGDFVSCLDFLRQAQKYAEAPYDEDDLSLRLEIADTYSRMGLYTESNREYFRISAFEYGLDEVFYGLIKNFIMMEMTALAAYYLNLGLEMGVLDPEDGFMPVEIDALPQKSGLYLVKPNDNEYTVQVAKQLMGSSDTEFAKQMLRSVPKSSPQFKEASNYLALLEMSDGNIEQGLQYCDEALAKDGSDLDALTTKILGLSMSGRKEESALLMNELDALDVTDWEKCTKAAVCAAQAQDSMITAKYTERALKALPYDRDMLLLNALSNFNLENRSRAKDSIVKLSIIYPDDHTAFYLAREIDTAENGFKFPLSSDLAALKKQQLTEFLDQSLKGCKTPSEFAVGVLKDMELKRAVMWALSCQNVNLSAKIGAILAQSRAGFLLARDVLLDPEASVIVKKAVFSKLLQNGTARVLQMVVGNHIQCFKPSIPPVTKNKGLINAYWQVYGTLAFIDSGFDRKLNIWYKKTVAALEYEGIQKFDEKAVAAVIAFKSRINKIFALNSYCCEVFDCKAEDFMLYCKILDSYGQVKKLPKAQQKHY